MTATTGAQADEVQVPHRPDIPGLRFRHFRGPEDYPGMAAANQRTRDEAGIQEIITAEGMAHTYAHLVHSDLATDLLVVERDGHIVAYARVEWRDLVDGSRQFTTICLLDPFQRRQGIGRAMLGWSEARLASIAAGQPDLADRTASMQTFTFATEVGTIALLERTGWSRVGYGYEMVRSDLDDLPDLAMPAGLQARPVGTDLASRRQVWDALVDAFRDHRAEPEATEVDWEEFHTNPSRDPSLWVVGFDGEEIAGAVLGLINPAENLHHGRERGYIDAVFTRPPWRRRGLARALIARALVRLRDHGMTSAYLGVDGLNPNQAVTLYRDLGFEIETTSIDWTKPLPAGNAGPLGPTEDPTP
ncbi:MAG: GNAT family N-acetyltransferase [Candidatus Limnocylindrales bacterium]